MLASLRRWLTAGTGRTGGPGIASWAHESGLAVKRSRQGDGFVVEGTPAQGWRLEWGPSQRGYIGGPELRIRAELRHARQLQMLVMSRQLVEALEKQVFEQCTEGLQTRIDTGTPEEMRWLVMYARQSDVASRALRDRYGAVASAPRALAQWLAGPFARALLDARETWLAPDVPMAVVMQRGRLTLRMALAWPEPARLDSVLALYTTALAEARRVAELWDTTPADGPSTQPSLWTREGSDVELP